MNDHVMREICFNLDIESLKQCINNPAVNHIINNQFWRDKFFNENLTIPNPVPKTTKEWIYAYKAVIDAQNAY
jgi:hypothetical protein